MLPPGLYPPSAASFQTLLANISAAQRQQHMVHSMSPTSMASSGMMVQAQQHHQMQSSPVLPPIHHHHHHQLGSSSQQMGGTEKSNASLSSPPPPPLSTANSNNDGHSAASSPSLPSYKSSGGPVGLEPYTGASVSPNPPLPLSHSPPSGSIPDDRRSSSIAALRLRAREHELRLEMIRQNGSHSNDVAG